MSLGVNIKSWMKSFGELPKLRTSIQTAQQELEAIKTSSGLHTDLLTALGEETRVNAGLLRALRSDDEQVTLIHALSEKNQQLEVQNQDLNADVQKFHQWLNSINVVSSKTTYGEMLISPYDRVQCSRVIPEVNYEEHRLSGIVQFLVDQYSFSCDTFIDIGSNIGTQSVYMLKTDLAKRSISIEPDPQNYRLLRCNFIVNGVDDRSATINCAFGDFDGEVDFELSKDNFGDHRVRLQEFDGWVQNEQYRDVIRVPLHRPKTALQQYNIDYSKALIWLDAQGLEGHILQSFLADGERIRYFVCEYWPYGIECAGGREKFLDIMRKCETIYDIQHIATDKKMSMADVEAYYDDALSKEANYKVFSLDLLCIVKMPE